jgi:hypothetical protein
MSEKFCIFCGEKPKDKNQEHVVPQWLIHMTKREKGDVFSLYPDAKMHLPFMRFTFPACTECNSKYSRMEAMVKPVLERVLSGQSISGADASLLMDWFDKVRIGLWLSNMYYNPKLKQEIGPHFFIDSRVAKTDRMLSVQKLQLSDSENKGIYFNGTQTQLFNYCPSAFTMVINDYYFFNASNNNLVSPRVGFPALSDVKVEDESTGSLSADFMVGRHKVANPIIQSFIPNKESITFYQPIYRDYLCIPDFPKDDYVVEHSYDVSNGLGGVFVQKGNAGNTRYLQPTDKVGTKLNSTPMPDLSSDVLQFQNAIQSKNIVSSPDTLLGKNINAIMLDSIKRQK